MHIIYASLHIHMCAHIICTPLYVILLHNNEPRILTHFAIHCYNFSNLIVSFTFTSLWIFYILKTQFCHISFSFISSPISSICWYSSTGYTVALHITLHNFKFLFVPTLHISIFRSFLILI